MGPLVFAKNFLMVAGAGQVFRSSWVGFDSEFELAELHVHCQTFSPTAGLTNGYSVSIESSFDTVESNPVGSALLVVTPGSQSTLISQDIGPLVRVRIKSTEAFAMVAIVSVWLQAKAT
jgi:hypothetical protein